MGDIENNAALHMRWLKRARAWLMYVLVRYFLHSALGKGVAAFCVVSEQQLAEGRPMVGGGESEVAGDSGEYMAGPIYIIWDRII